MSPEASAPGRISSWWESRSLDTGKSSPLRPRSRPWTTKAGYNVNVNALKKAKGYQKSMHISPDRIYDQLVHEYARSSPLRKPTSPSRTSRCSHTRYDEGTDEQGNPIEVVDRLKDTLMAAAARQRKEPISFISDREVFGDLIDDERFVRAYSGALTSLHVGGAKDTLRSPKPRF